MTTKAMMHDQSEREKQPVKIRHDLDFVVVRLQQILPAALISSVYTSFVEGTGGMAEFPYFRVDTSLASVRMRIKTLMLSEELADNDKNLNTYRKASMLILATLAWVEHGFGGLEKLWQNPTASSNVRQTIDGDELAGLAALQRSYQKTIEIFKQYRESHNITQDCFTEYHVEFLLGKI